MSSNSVLPKVAIWSIRLLSVSSASGMVQRPGPMNGRVGGAILTDIILWSEGIIESFIFQFESCCARLQLVYIRSSRDIDCVLLIKVKQRSFGWS